MPIEEPPASIEEELEWTKRQVGLMEGKAQRREPKKVVPHVKFFDAYMCFQKGEWDTISDELRRRYVMILRRAANANTFSTDEVRKNALAVLESLGLPAESEKKQREARKEPLTEKEKQNIEKSRRILVDRQKRLIVEKLAANEITKMFGMVDPGPYQLQAIDELVAEGRVVLIDDETLPITRGRPPYDGSPRRSKRVMRLGLPMDTNARPEPAQASPAASQEEDLI